MRSSRKKKETISELLVLSHLSGINRALLEGEKRPAFWSSFGKPMIAAGSTPFTTAPVDSTTQARRPICHEDSINISVTGTPRIGVR